MASDIRNRLCTAESDFLDAILRDVQTLEANRLTWEILAHDIESAIQTQSLDDEILELAFVTTSRISILSEGFLNIDTDDITSQLSGELDEILSKLSLASASPPSDGISECDRTLSPPSGSCSTPFPAHRAPNHEDTPRQSLPPYIAPAYEWLLSNLHDPYPSNDVKRIISETTGTDIRHVKAWFINSRRRIGWTAIAREYFAGGRPETVDAAHRAFVAEDPEQPLDPDLRLRFEQMKATVEDLYSDKLGKSILTSAYVRNPTDDHHEKPRSYHSGDQECAKIKHTTREQCATVAEAAPPIEDHAVERTESSCPSPLTSSHVFPQPHTPDSLSDLGESTESDTSLPQRGAGHKRRISSCSLELDDSFYSRVNKRLRPASTLPEADVHISRKSPVRINANHCSAFLGDIPPTSRKRRYSDVDITPMPKRPQGLSHGPRQQTVSDPLPIRGATQDTSQFEHWFKDYFELPESVATEELDVSTPLEVDLFSDWTVLTGARVGPPDPYSQTQPPDAAFPPITLDAGTAPQVLCFENHLRDTTRQALFLFPHNWLANSEHILPDTAVYGNDDLPCPPLSTSGSSCPASPLETDLSDFFNVDDLLSLPEWSLISASDHATDGQPSSLLSFAGLDSFVPVDGYPTQYDTALPFNHNPSYPSVSGFFDDIISQGIPSSNCGAFVPLVPSVARPLDHSCYAIQDTLDRQSKLEELRKLQAEARKLEAELAL